MLDRYLRHLVEAHPGESLTLVGHSAGGVLARLQMVKHPDVPVATLITIASPHLGLEVADIAARLGGELMQELARSLGEPMAEELVRRFGLGVANDTLSLLGELATERPGNLLHWLNHQPHPPARYVAVVRDTATPIGFLGHLLLSSRSQDMGNVEALHGRVTTVRFGEDHLLTADDGPFLARLLGSLRISRLPSQRHDLALRSP
ncbi:MAG: hypothetical protein H6983_25585 [Ectothiorhodospiraceae bacterium]|nr:hypothetical protein [Chromatiales bacterium]MCP5157574.1 hypothetical protein [Ectothiorhodospiraceae bacterium]